MGRQCRWAELEGASLHRWGEPRLLRRDWADAAGQSKPDGAGQAKWGRPSHMAPAFQLGAGLGLMGTGLGLVGRDRHLQADLSRRGGSGPHRTGLAWRVGPLEMGPT
ncbi:hypothetical protein H6P81_010192 [Aristolochia fimbriata]|uniref:Uncharacterized protein n=1 Tax=Aristolochia fimbriata TaxID=158543 RepID=A0AAV7ERF2_ARIFI|nr:hypothetical protein H6P81_010192 [Aristolochia fimbriata]